MIGFNLAVDPAIDAEQITGFKQQGTNVVIASTPGHKGILQRLPGLAAQSNDFPEKGWAGQNRRKWVIQH